MARPPNSYPATVRTTQVTVDGVAASTLIVTQVTGYRVVLVSMVLGAAGVCTLEFWEGVTGTIEQAKKMGPIPLPDGTTAVSPLDVRRGPEDAIVRTAVGKGLTIKPIGGVAVSGVVSYYLERAE